MTRSYLSPGGRAVKHGSAGRSAENHDTLETGGEVCEHCGLMKWNLAAEEEEEEEEWEEESWGSGRLISLLIISILYQQLLAQQRRIEGRVFGGALLVFTDENNHLMVMNGAACPGDRR